MPASIIRFILAAFAGADALDRMLTADEARKRSLAGGEAPNPRRRQRRKRDRKKKEPHRPQPAKCGRHPQPPHDTKRWTDIRSAAQAYEGCTCAGLRAGEPCRAGPAPSMNSRWRDSWCAFHAGVMSERGRWKKPRNRR